MRVSDFTAGDRVRHKLNRALGTVREVTLTQVEVEFDAGWSGTYDALWFAGCDYLEKIEGQEMARHGVLSADDDSAIVARLVDLVTLANRAFNGAPEVDDPAWGVLVLVWPRDQGDREGRVLSNATPAAEIKRTIRAQIETLQAALDAAPKENGHNDGG